MIDDMRMRQLAPKTQDIYLHIVREFARFLGRSPHTATVEDLRRYQLYLVDHGTSAVSLNHAITGLKSVSYTHLDVYKRQGLNRSRGRGYGLTLEVRERPVTRLYVGE
ncbi:hypothetical protein PMI06_005607 [Burkholderia sp. BT03]|nr:hypothetical protein PMI06_005607 [Burkholderia sp. BT03]